MSKGLLLATLIAVAAVSVYFVEQNNKVDAFEQWKNDFGTEFQLGQEPFRRIIFEQNIRQIERHNADSTQSYTKGINQFTIYTEEEFKQRFLSEMMVPETEVLQQVEDIEESTESNGDIDWVSKGKVSHVKNQGQCGSCWAFSATGVAESWALLSGKTADLSEQQLIDCSKPQGNHGCHGGWPSYALKYVKASGIASETEYPYKAKDGTCSKQGGSFKIGGYASTKQTCANMQNVIQSKPLSVTVDASNWSSYRSGVFNNCRTSINHAVLLVGLQSNEWKIKNSWGTSWGEGGYIRLASGNTCGVCSYGATYVV